MIVDPLFYRICYGLLLRVGVKLLADGLQGIAGADALFSGLQ